MEIAWKKILKTFFLFFWTLAPVTLASSIPVLSLGFFWCPWSRVLDSTSAHNQLPEVNSLWWVVAFKEFLCWLPLQNIYVAWGESFTLINTALNRFHLRFLKIVITAYWLDVRLLWNFLQITVLWSRHVIFNVFLYRSHSAMNKILRFAMIIMHCNWSFVYPQFRCFASSPLFIKSTQTTALTRPLYHRAHQD